MSLHLYICTQFCQAWHIHLQFNNIVITRYSAGPAIDIIGRDYGVNHLHKLSRSLDCASDSSFSHCLVGQNFSRLAIFACLLFVESIMASAAPGVLPRRCKGMREYVRKPPPFPIARDAAGARECGAT